MQPYDIAFARLGHFLPFFHITSVIFFIGIQVGFWLIFRSFLVENSENLEYKKVLKILKKFGISLFLSIFFIFVTGFLLGQNDFVKVADPMANGILMTKYALAVFLILNLVYMTFCYLKAAKRSEQEDHIESYENIFVIINYFMPLNIVTSLVATYLGVAYRSF